MHRSNKPVTFRAILVIVLLSILTISIGSGSNRTAAQSTGEQDAVLVSVENLTWSTDETYAGANLRLSGPDGLDLEFEFMADEQPVFSVRDAAGSLFPDGGFNFEVQFTPYISSAAQSIMENAGMEERESILRDLIASGDVIPGQTLNGHFVIQNGYVLVDALPESEVERLTSIGSDVLASQSVNDQLVYDDLITTGSLCVGFDCADGESFGFDAIRLKEHNLRIHFDDTSYTGSYPTNSWRITINDSTNGGASYFAIDDADDGTRPFTIEAGAPSNSLYVEDYGRIGFGTSTPVVELHIRDSDTPTVRLEQDSSGGWTAQTWDVAGNESNFFIRDATNGSKLSFRIQPSAPSDSLTIKSTGYVGLGTWSPTEHLHLSEANDTITNIAIENSNGIWRLGNTTAGAIFSFNDNIVSTLDTAGNLTIEGALTEASDVNLKENFEDVSSADILRQIADMRLSTWNYIADDDSVRHLGPMAQDFYVAFGLGADDTHIAPLDVNGVTLAGMQALIDLNAEQDARIEELESENADLEARLTVLEEQMLALLEAQE